MLHLSCVGQIFVLDPFMWLFDFYILYFWEKKHFVCVATQQSMQQHQSVNSTVDHKGLGWHLGQAHSKVSNVPKYK